MMSWHKKGGYSAEISILFFKGGWGPGPLLAKPSDQMVLETTLKINDHPQESTSCLMLWLTQGAPGGSQIG